MSRRVPSTEQRRERHRRGALRALSSESLAPDRAGYVGQIVIVIEVAELSAMFVDAPHWSSYENA